MIKTLLIGPLFSRSGYGEHARFVFKALASQPNKFDLHAHPIHWGKSSWMATEKEDVQIKQYEKFYSVTDEKFNNNEFEKYVPQEYRVNTKGI